MGQIRELYNQVQTTATEIEALKPVKMLSTSVNYQKNRVLYEYQILQQETGNLLTLEFTNVPEEYVHNIRVIAVAVPTSADIEGVTVEEEGIMSLPYYQSINTTFMYFIGRGENNSLIIKILVGDGGYSLPGYSLGLFKIIFMTPREQYELRTRKS